jgi:NifU-like protein involved in Fe-S cluster formation
MYNNKVMDRFRNPRFVGRITGADAVGEVGAKSCGDIMKVYIKLDANKDKIVKASFETFGCGTAIASTDVACELLIGRTMDEALKIKNTDILKELGDIPNQKIHCSVLGEEAIEAAYKDYQKRKEAEEKAAKKKAKA